MLGLELIKQTIENNAAKPAINPSIVKKLALSRLNTDIKISNEWMIKDELDKIVNSNLDDETKGELIEFLKSECYKLYEEANKELNELFGSDNNQEKQASIKSDEDSGTKGEKEEIAKAPEGESNEEADDDKKDEHKTPAEHVIEQKPGQSAFNY